MNNDIKKIVTGSVGELIAVAAVVVDMIGDKLKEITEDKKKPVIDFTYKERED